MEQSILELPKEQKEPYLVEIKHRHLSEPYSFSGTVKSLFWLSPLGYLFNKERFNESWNILYLKDTQ